MTPNKEEWRLFLITIQSQTFYSQKEILELLEWWRQERNKLDKVKQ